MYACKHYPANAVNSVSSVQLLRCQSGLSGRVHECACVAQRGTKHGNAASHATCTRSGICNGNMSAKHSKSIRRYDRQRMYVKQGKTEKILRKFIVLTYEIVL
jgi:hypothetical protein